MPSQEINFTLSARLARKRKITPENGSASHPGADFVLRGYGVSVSESEPPCPVCNILDEKIAVLDTKVCRRSQEDEDAICRGPVDRVHFNGFNQRIGRTACGSEGE